MPPSDTSTTPATSAAQQETARVKAIYDQHADTYDGSITFFERVFFGGGRAWACGQAHGEVLEIAIGTGRNLPYYPADVTLIGIDLSPAMLEHARRRAATLGRAVTLLEGDVQSLPCADGSFDTVVSTLTLCSIPDEQRAVREVWRVLRPGGRFVALEHVGSPQPIVRGVERLLEPLAIRFQGDHLLREPAAVAQGAGFTVERVERSHLGIVERLVARR